MKPWREVAAPHPDVLEGTFQQSEFAADITAVRNGEASREYQQASAFFERTYITEGMRLLLTQVARRLNGKGGEPVVQLQTAFGGGKTHTMLAVYHLATRTGSLNELAGVPALLDQASVLDVPRAKVAILDGTAHAPGQPWRRGASGTSEGFTVHTLWGELAWQLGGLEAYEKVKSADTSGTSPGKEVLQTLLAEHAPCVVLVDELVAYVRQFPDGPSLPGGTYDSNLSFVQALTEAVKLVPNAVLLASLPESELEAGSSRGSNALRALEKTFGRVQALWKPVATEESFEIVRRRLFQPIQDLQARDAVCRAFAEVYRAEGAKLPSETQEGRYLGRLTNAYPIHPEVFDRLYEDWSSLDTFQRTRGVLKLMAHVIHELWAKGNADLAILPSSLPLYRGKTRDELLSHLPPGWDPVLDRDIDDERAESAELDQDPRFGTVQAARRIARATFFGSAPSSVGTKSTTRGVDRARIVLGCLQPGQSFSLYSDALNRLYDRVHYLNASGDKSADNTRFWFDTHANLRREMEDRKGRFQDRNEVHGRISEIVDELTRSRKLFDGIHVFTAHADVPDDSRLRLVVIEPDRHYSKQAPHAFDAVREYVRHHGTKPRFKGNRLIFVAADAGAVTRMRDATRTALAWASIVKDIGDGRLNVDRLRESQAKKEAESASAVATRAVRDAYKWLLCPTMHAATDRDIEVEVFPLNTGSGAMNSELERVCEENELVIRAWSPIHLRSLLQKVYWTSEESVNAMRVWEDFEKFLYLPRLHSRAVFEDVLRRGAETEDFFGVAYGRAGDRYEGFRLGATSVSLDDTLLLIQPAAASAYREARAKSAPPPKRPSERSVAAVGGGTSATEQGARGPTGLGPTSGAGRGDQPSTHFFGAVDVPAATAKMKLVELADEIIAVLGADPNGTVLVTLEIRGEFPDGVPDHIKRAVNENAAQLGFRTKDWD